MKVRIHSIIKRTAGGFHSWCASNVGRIRKPNSSISKMIKQREEEIPIRDFIIKPKWYERLYRWLIKLFKKWLKK